MQQAIGYKISTIVGGHIKMIEHMQQFIFIENTVMIIPK
jgi:hypothetical protein